MGKSRRLILRGQVWKYVERRIKKAYGLCHHGHRLIEVDPTAVPREKADTQVHEIMHALFPDLKEEVVQAVATEMTNALCELNVSFKRKWRND